MTSFQKMSLKSSSLFALCFSFCLLFNSVRASNITQILSQYPDFSTFSSYLTQTQLAGEINSRQTITVLVVENGNMSPLSGKPDGEIKNVLSGHVILDYYDVAKLQKLQNKTAMLTTLFQSSGQAKGQQGFLNVTVLGSDSVAFGSAVPGSSLSSNLVKSVSSQPYNISVLQVSNIIVPEGTGNTNSTTSPVPVGPPKTSPTPASSPNKPPSTSNPPPRKAPAPSTAKPPPTHAPAPSMAKPPAASAPSATPPAMSISPVGGPSPTTADGPAADSPASSPPAMDGPIAATPAADGPLADAPSDPKSDASVINTGNNLALLALILLSAFFLA